MRVELLHVRDCPNLEQARQLLRDCLAELGLGTAVEEVEGDFASPTIRVNGIDVMGRTAVDGAFCRLDPPTRGRLLSALRAAHN